VINTIQRRCGVAVSLAATTNVTIRRHCQRHHSGGLTQAGHSIRRMNPVIQRRARLVLNWVTVVACKIVVFNRAVPQPSLATRPWQAETLAV